MKKQIKIVSMMLVIFMVVATLSNIVLASSTIEQQIQTIGKGNQAANADEVVNLGATIVTIMQTVGIVVAVVILLILGIKYMIGSAEEKAEYKKTMIPYLVGAILIFASTTIVNVVYNMANAFNK
ncbi:MAG: hypothetical protein HFJ42_03480 [Clostridia bacterium]|nr:hypothetical protein [Clostridia bacterium]